MGKPRHGESLTYKCQGSELNSYCLALKSMILPTLLPSKMHFQKGIVRGMECCEAMASSNVLPALLYGVRLLIQDPWEERHKEELERCR